MIRDDSAALERVKEIFTAAVECPPEQRSELLRQQCGADPALRREVEELLGLHESPGLALDTPLSRLAEARFEPGTVLAGRYRIIRPVAAGGMGEVYEAADTESGDRVAVKFIRRLAALADPALEARFLREARLAQSIHHPNVCRTLALAEHRGEPFSVMEYLEGETLAERLKREGRLTPGAALPLAAQICDGLEAAHRAGVIHRDLKPGNVFLTSGRAVLLDFGLAAPVDRQASLTTAGAVIGTLAYMAPEQMEEGRAGPRADLYSLGVVLHEMLTGERPHTATSPLRLAAQKAREEHHSPGKLQGSVPPVWREVIGRCLRLKPEQRYGSAGEIRAALERGRASLGFWMRRPVLWAPAGAAAALLVCWLGWRLWTADPLPKGGGARWYSEGQEALMQASPWRGAQILEKAVEADGHFVPARALLAVAYAEVDQPDKAREALLRATAERDSRWRRGRVSGLALDGARSAVIGDYAGAAAHYQRLAAATANRERSFALLATARMLERTGTRGEALAILQRVVAEDPGNLAARVRYGLLLARQRQPEASAAELRAVEQGYERAGNWEGLADLLLVRSAAGTQDPGENRRDLERVAELSRRTGNRYHQLSAKFRMAIEQVRDHEYEKALVLARETAEESRAAGMPGVAAGAMTELGYTYLYLKRPEEGIPILREAVRIAEQTHSPATLADSRMRLAEGLGQVRQIKEAVGVMEPAVQWARQHGRAEALPLVLIKWGTLLHSTARSDEVAGVLTESLDLASRNGNELYQAMALQRLGSMYSTRDLRQATAYWDRAVALGRKTRLTGAYFQAAAVYAQFGDFHRAEQLFAEGDRANLADQKGVDQVHFAEYGQAGRAAMAYYRGRCDEARTLVPRNAVFERDWREMDTCSVDPAVLRATAAWLGQQAGNTDDSNRVARLAAWRARIDLKLGDFQGARRWAERGLRAATVPVFRSIALENALVLRAAERRLGNREAVERLGTQCLDLARDLGYNPPERFGGRQDLLAWWLP